MRRFMMAAGLWGFMAWMVMGCGGAETEAQAAQVRLETNMGNIELELFPQAAPKTVDNFLTYVRDGAYSNTIFHRVIKRFMIQGGGLTPDMVKKPTRAPVMNEADNGLKNTRGTLAMARTQDPHSATAQFFINTKDNDFLDHQGKTVQGWGYCVFGRVVSGMEVVDAIEGTATTVKNGRKDVPVSAVVIKQAMIVD